MVTASTDGGPPDVDARDLAEAWLNHRPPGPRPTLPPHLAGHPDPRLALLSRAYEAMHIATMDPGRADALVAIESICTGLRDAGWQRALRLAEVALSMLATIQPQRHAQALALLESHGPAELDARPPMERIWTDLAASNLFRAMGRYDDALRAGLNGQRLAAATDLPGLHFFSAHALSNIFLDVGDLEGALALLQSETCEQRRRASGRVFAYYNLLLALVLARRLDEIRDVLQRQPALNEDRVLNDHPPSAYLLAGVYSLLGEQKRAEALIARAAPIGRFAEPDTVVDCAWLCAAVILEGRDPDGAIRWITSFLATHAAQHLSPISGTQLYRLLSEAHEASGNATLALRALKESQRYCFSWVATSLRSRLVALDFDRQASPGDEALHARRLHAIDHAAAMAQRPAADEPPGSERHFLAHVMHEMRNPLSGVIGMTSLLMMSNLDVRQRQYANLANTSAQTLLALCNDILDVAKLSAGRFELTLQATDVAAVIRDTVEILRPLAEAKSLSYCSTVQASIPHRLQCDPLRLRQVLMNLLTNAIKFTARGEVRVEATWCGTRGSAGHGELKLSVRDTGRGLDSYAKAHLFEEFAQFEAEKNGNIAGTGLGLSLCRRLVKMMDGRIEVDSEVGRGSAFTVFLPFAAASASRPAPDDSGARGSVARLGG